MVVVIAIIALLLGAVLPSMNAVWQERKAADAETLVRGTLASIRMKALHDKERGLFFMLDGDVQKVYEIEAEPFDPSNPADTGLDDQITSNRFLVTTEKGLTLPKPYRVTPRSVVDGVPGSPGTPLWSDAELTRQDYRAGPDSLERHRNFFTIIFSPDGQLRVNRNVLIHDPDGTQGSTHDNIGDLTGLWVAGGMSWFDGTTAQPFTTNLPQMVTNTTNGTPGQAINFPSVDGLMVYDDSSFAEFASAADKRDYLLRTGQPLYVARLSGAVIRGPLGENQ